jgi:glycosyltransferase involved in cell wall biosynthesis
MTVQDKLVSVIIPTFNSGKTISACLNSIKSQTYGKCEIIIVDRLSKDSTTSISKQYGCKIIESLEKRSSARNLGASHASGDYFVFIDSDMQLSSTTIEECVRLSETSSFDTLIVPEISTGMGFWSKCIALEKELYLNNELIESPCFFTRSSFLGIGGYDATLEAGEDWDISTRLLKSNYRIGRVKSLIFHNEGQVTLSKLFRKKYYYGQSIPLYSSRHPDLARAQLSPIRFVNKKSFASMFRSPALGIGLVMMKSVEYSGLFLGSKTGGSKQNLSLEISNTS